MRQLYRNGYRDWDSWAGRIALEIPKLRKGSYFPSFLKSDRTAGKALVPVIPYSSVMRWTARHDTRTSIVAIVHPKNGNCRHLLSPDDALAGNVKEAKMKSSNTPNGIVSAIKERLLSPARKSPLRVNISCVVDDSPVLRMQAWNWLLSLAALSTECRIFVHYLPGALSEKTQNEFTTLGATLIPVQRFGIAEAKYCNKIHQLGSEALLEADFVILSDADIAFLEDPAQMIREGKFRAKTVDAPNPPEDIWCELFRRAGLADKIGKRTLDMYPEERTFETNFNGGLYVMPAAMARRLYPLWEKYARWCLDQPDLLDKYLHHADQLGLGLALAESRDRVDLLPFGANTPTHFPAKSLELVERQNLGAIHYHSHTDQHGLPKPVGVEWIDKHIMRIRTAIEQERRKRFSNDLFWDFRYAVYPELGSGLGSRQEALEFKRDLLRPYVEMIGDGSVLDVGCGDLEVLAPLPIANYTGIDLSSEALSIALTKRPDWRFEKQLAAELPENSFDYTFCIDVLIHQPNAEAARVLARDLVRIARKGVIFSCHTESLDRSGISFDSHGLETYLAGLPEISSLNKIGTYRDVTMYFAEKGMGERLSVHDIGLHEMAVGARYSPNALKLKHLIKFSREKIGFFPKTIIRTHEYSWFIEHIQDCAGKRILDVGAGVCCLPFYLADCGAEVTTVDRHHIMRNSQPKEAWNEWGFLDYGALQPGIKSFNMDMGEFDTDESFDIIYSVSVIEHMTAKVRQAVISQMSRLMRTQGALFLSLDLFPGSMLLWNYNEGKIVDSQNHGTLDDIKAELTASGFDVFSESFVRGMPLSRTDVAYLVCKKSDGVPIS